MDICHETVRHWWNRFGPMFASDIVGNEYLACAPFDIGGGTSMKCT